MFMTVADGVKAHFSPSRGAGKAQDLGFSERHSFALKTASLARFGRVVVFSFLFFLGFRV